ncbi:hypothetical protein PBI_COOPER_89 [Mycobacterium phage Cooper]|uniref:HNH endonuclease n=2 Tax=Coopervirus TaxID=1982898 RepID=T2A9B5_9CAUD|nr:HNH endonuclease [Mycobacterium phage Adawi]YP_654986.1 HNH endonuclease [Mycobacterium phage Cooper]ABD58206.1 hypothetical protein PBI_COOPER_89 [Mycobacterium phage Cooper]AGU91999.1 HNH endonuclease [Mycobacterium phage Adawi]
MDPNAALAELIDYANAVLNDEADTYPDNLGQDATALAERFMGLHTWIVGGGFLPAAWNAGRN